MWRIGVPIVEPSSRETLSDKRRTFWQHFRQFFLRGLAAVLPAILTVALLVWLFSLISQYFGEPIKQALVEVAVRVEARGQDPTDADLAILRGQVREEWDRYLTGLSFVLGILGVYLFGRFVTSFFGRGIWRATERAISGVPVVKLVYPSVKQVTDFLLAERKKEFSRVVAVEYPRKGIWSLGLVTSPGMRSLDEAVEGDLLTVFIPSSPTPVTGYTITVRRDEVLELSISIDEALRFTISGGVIQPLSERVGDYEIKPFGTEPLTPSEDKEIIA
jgi:uncharacterized membrane protein